MQPLRIQLVNFPPEQLSLALVVLTLQSIVNQYSVNGGNVVITLTLVEDTLTAIVPIPISELPKVTQQLRESLGSSFEIHYNTVGRQYKIYVKGF